MKFIILVMSIYTADWAILEPEYYSWDNRADCEYFIDHNLIKRYGEIYGCAILENWGNL